MTKYWYDCEFIEDGKTIDLISIGIVAEDGREYYAQSCEFDAEKASVWVQEHVFTNLSVCAHVSGDLRGLYVHQEGQCYFETPAKIKSGLRGVRMSGGHLLNFYADCPWRTREQMKRDILVFMDIKKYGKPELWGYYSAYDHVAFCQLFGTMMDLSKGFPMYTRDLKQWCDMLGNPRLPKQEVSEHHALADARWNRLIWQFLNDKKG